MSDVSYDFIVIGGGSGGYAAARTACDHGMKTAVVDGAEELGGLCILRGCMPSKTLIETANRSRAIRNAGRFGLVVESPGLDSGALISRKRFLIGDFAGYRQGQLESGRFDLHRGHARFLDDHRLEVIPREDGEQPVILTFRTACIATGSAISKIPVPGLEETGYWTSDDALEAVDLPESLVVLGGGAIALEMACYFEGLGKEVTVVQRSDQLLRGSDRDVALELEKAMNSRPNLKVITGTTLREVRRNASGKKEVIFDHSGEVMSVAADEILQALGRRPNSTDLNLEAAGIEVEPTAHIRCNARQQTSLEHVFAAGDVCGPHEIVHIAIEQGEKAAENAALLQGRKSGDFQEMDYRLKLFGIFTDPQVAMVGLTEEEAKEKGIDTISASHPFDDHGKSMIMDEMHGFVKLIANRENGELIGGAVVGPEAVELIHEIVVALNFRSTASEFLKIPHYHPTLSEIWTYPAEELII